jgi:hypothetical protein
MNLSGAAALHGAIHLLHPAAANILSRAHAELLLAGYA